MAAGGADVLAVAQRIIELAFDLSGCRLLPCRNASFEHLAQRIFYADFPSLVDRWVEADRARRNEIGTRGQTDLEALAVVTIDGEALERGQRDRDLGLADRAIVVDGRGLAGQSVEEAASHPVTPPTESLNFWSRVWAVGTRLTAV